MTAAKASAKHTRPAKAPTTKPALKPLHVQAITPAKPAVATKSAATTPTLPAAPAKAATLTPAPVPAPSALAKPKPPLTKPTGTGKEALLSHVEALCRNARPAARAVALLSDQQRRTALIAAADALASDAAVIRGANAKDVAQAGRDGLAPAMVDRLRLDGKRRRSSCDGIRLR